MRSLSCHRWRSRPWAALPASPATRRRLRSAAVAGTPPLGSLLPSLFNVTAQLKPPYGAMPYPVLLVGTCIPDTPHRATNSDALRTLARISSLTLLHGYATLHQLWSTTSKLMMSLLLARLARTGGTLMYI